MNALQTLVVVTLLTACSSTPTQHTTIDKADAVGVKADSSLERRLCRAVGFPGDCDICYEAGWYGDGECDTFCQSADSDCVDASMPGFPTQCASDGDLNLRVSGSGHDAHEGKQVWVIAEQNFISGTPGNERVTALEGTITSGAFDLRCPKGLVAGTAYPVLTVVIDSSDDLQCDGTDMAWSTTSFGWSEDQFISLDEKIGGLAVTYQSGSTTWTNMEEMKPLSLAASMFGVPEACDEP